MQTATAAPPAASGWSTRTRVVGWVLLVCWLALTAFVAVSGPRDASRAALRGALEAGHVDTLEVEGGLSADPDTHGYADLQLRWRDGWQVRQVEVREARPIDDEARDTDLDVVPAGEVERIQADYPGLRVERVSDVRSAHRSVTVLGAHVERWTATAVVVVGLATLALLIAGPEPWRATRWAWFWLGGLAPPLAILAYLLAGGPTGVLGAPRSGTRRFTGGWAFLLTFVLGSSVSLLGAIL